MSNDEEWAKQVLAKDPTEKPPRVRMSDFSPEVERLTDLCDLVMEAIRTMAGLKGVKPGPPRPMPRPVTALERARRRKRERTHKSLVARMLPHEAANGAGSR
ncbi:hypothetical protein [Micromonospora maritima]|uniref:hypothetical protein n=1 Tax=Micromonospora maritima TaxID=986711 RepID=UPI00157C29A1|nr:hypothetical protein [Micromonospora maritima]